MIEPFEARLADLLADRTAGTAEIDRVTRARDGLPAIPVGKARATVQLVGGDPSLELGDDRRETLPDRLSQRPVVRLTGEVQVAVEAARGNNDADQRLVRRVLLRAVDAVLLALQDETVRDGRAFATPADQGFALDGFRLIGVAPDAVALDNFRRLVLRYAYSGRFWPVVPAVAGPAIARVPTRVAVLPIEIPEAPAVRAGGANLTVPLAVDLRAFEGAEARLVARLRGASPPGALVGDATNLPPGWVGYLPGADGRFQVVYRPPSSIDEEGEALVTLGLASPQRPTVSLGELRIVVRP